MNETITYNYNEKVAIPPSTHRTIKRYREVLIQEAKCPDCEMVVFVGVKAPMVGTVFFICPSCQNRFEAIHADNLPEIK